jgi:1-acyl-sn-glycerol-3-phosphate acyltransferase
MTGLSAATPDAVRPGPDVRLTARIVWRQARIVLWSAAAAAAWAVGMVLLFPSLSAKARWHGIVLRTWGRALIRTLGARVEIEGPVPEPPFLLVSNHLSYVDIPLLASILGCNFVARHDVRTWTGMGTAARLVGTVFVNRRNRRDAVRVIDEIHRRLDQGRGIVIFPEGTSTRGDRVYPMKSSLLAVAAIDNHPVYYCSVSYRTASGMPSAETLVCWWGDMQLGPHLRELCRADGFDATVRIGPEPIQESDRKRLADRLHAAITASFTPVMTSGST